MSTPDQFDLAFDQVRRLHRDNARHRRAFRLGDMTTLDILKSAAGELMEAADATNDFDLRMEIADVMNCLLHVAVKKGWTLNHLGQAMLEKLAVAFPSEAQS